MQQPSRTLGVEEELLILDRRTLSPSPIATEVSAEANSEQRLAVPIETEFKREQIETGTAPAHDLLEARRQLVGLRAKLNTAAAQEGAHVAALATCPTKVRPAQSDSERYDVMSQRYGLLADQQLTCGQHVHVSIESREEGVAVLDRIRIWMPVIAALASNSPYWQGQDTGYASYRSVVWGMWPTAGPAALFGDVAGYDLMIDALLGTKTALDDAMLYFDARLSAKYPTVEVRVADVCARVDDAVLIAGLSRGLVTTAARAWREGSVAPDVPVAILRGARWRAARYGMTDELVDPDGRRTAPAWDVGDALLDYVRPALEEYGDLDRVTESLQRVRLDGTGAQLQRAAFARHGRLEDVISAVVDLTAAD